MRSPRNIIIFGVILIIIGGGWWFLVPDTTTTNATDERVVYVRSIDGGAFSYTATIDDVNTLLTEEVPTTDDSSRAITALSTLPVTNSATVAMVSIDGVESVGALQELLQTQPAYTNQVFTVTVVDGVIVGFNEETLE